MIRVYDWVMALLAVGAIFLLAIQYPFTVSFPLGNDTVTYLERSQKFNTLVHKDITLALPFLFGQTNYPASIVFFSALDLLPISPPLLFMWAIALVHALVGVAVLVIIWRLFHPLTGVLAGFFWGLSILLNHHISNGIFAHLLSLLPFVFTIYFLTRKRWLLVYGFYWLTFFTHPFSGFVLLLLCLSILVFLCTQAARGISLDRMYLRNLVCLILFTCGVFLLAILYRNVLAGELPVDHHVVSIFSLMSPYFVIVLFGSIIGLDVILKKVSSASGAVFIFPLLFVLVTALTFNNFLGLAFEVRRFESYFLLLICCLAGVGISYFLERMRNKRLLIFAVVVMVVGLTGQALHANAGVYAHNDLDTYGRLDAPDIEALDWLSSNIPSDAHILTFATQRKARWVSVISHRRTGQLPELSHYSMYIIPSYLHSRGYTYALFFTDGVALQSDYGFLNMYPTIFSNEDIVVKDLHDKTLSH